MSNDWAQAKDVIISQQNYKIYKKNLYNYNM